MPIGIKYKAIYADPPWSYDNKKTGGTLNSGSLQKYPTMSIEEISALPVDEIAAENCVLFLWCTVPLLPEGLEVMKSWGFTYKTMITWKKQNFFGLGYWFRGVTEHLLIGIKGDVKPFRIQKSNHIAIAPGQHSKKPQVFRNLIEQIPELHPRIELFARTKIHGWDVWGNDKKLEDLPLEYF
ncbi:MAG: MT-A70 family methyltransferase [Candidatus Kariarchaeaceae archaeon]